MGTTLQVAAPNGVYYVRVRARTAIGSSPPSNELQIIVPSLAAAPVLHEATVSGRNVNLSWTSSSTGVTVLARLAPTSAIVAALAVTGSSLSVPNVPPNVYYVTVIGSGGSVAGAESNQIVVES